MMERMAKFAVGQMVHHRHFNYRGVVYDVDAQYEGSDTIGSNDFGPDDIQVSGIGASPAEDNPWYHVLVDGSDDVTYVDERHLEPDDTGKPINHPELGVHFFQLAGKVYITYKPAN